MNNLLEETKEILKENNKSFDDVIWCGSESFGWFTKEKAIQLFNVDYDSGFGAQEVAKDLLVVGEDFWLERHEYDGSEWWEYKTIPKKPELEITPKHVCAATIEGHSMWDTLEDMNGK